MPHGDPEDDQDLVVDLVDNPVVAGADAPCALSAGEPFGTARARMVGRNSTAAWMRAPSCGIESVQLTHRVRGDLDPMGTFQRSSAQPPREASEALLTRRRSAGREPHGIPRALGPRSR